MGRPVTDPDVRQLFTREAVLASDWYRARLEAKQARDVALWTRHVAGDRDRTAAQAGLARVSSPEYLTSLVGTIGAHPLG